MPPSEGRDPRRETLPVARNNEEQEELIRAYCAEAERLLSEAVDFASARSWKDDLCARFQRECSSSLVVTAVSLHLDTVLDKRFGNAERGNDSSRHHG